MKQVLTIMIAIDQNKESPSLHIGDRLLNGIIQRIADYDMFACEEIASEALDKILIKQLESPKNKNRIEKKIKQNRALYDEGISK